MTWGKCYVSVQVTYLLDIYIYIHTYTYLHTYIHSTMITAPFYVATTQKNASTTQQSPTMATAFALMLSVEMHCRKTAHAPISDECKQNSILNHEFQSSLEAGNTKFSSFVTKKYFFFKYFKNYFLGDILYVTSAYRRVF